MGSVVAYEYEQRRQTTISCLCSDEFHQAHSESSAKAASSRFSPLTLEISDKGFDFVVAEAEKTRSNGAGNSSGVNRCRKPAHPERQIPKTLTLHRGLEP